MTGDNERQAEPIMPWHESERPGRVSPRECIRNARDALNRAYSHPGITDGRHALTFIAEAVDWQRRALEQMENSVTGDNERQAEIEAVAYVLHEAPPEADMALVARECIAALDRVCDARGDDEARLREALRALIDQTPGSHPLYQASVDALLGGAARSPQGEDHETARIAAHEAAQDYVDAAGGDDVDTGHVVDEALNAYLARVSPSRDGTVAVEDVERLQAAVDRAYGAMNASAYVGGPSEREAWQTALAALCEVVTQHKGQAEFGVSERIHDQATKEKR